MNHSPEKIIQEYNEGLIIKWELFGRLLGAVKSFPVSQIIRGLQQTELTEFRDFVEDMQGVTQDDEIGSTHGDPSFGVAEIRKFLDYFREHHRQR